MAGTTGERVDVPGSADVPLAVDVPVAATEEWAEITARALVATRIKAVEPGPFTARLRSMELGTSRLSAISYGSLRSQRTPRLIRQADPELYQLAVITSGRQGIEQARNSASLAPGQMVLYDTSRPFDAFADADAVADRGRTGSVVLQFPKAQMPFPAPRVARLLAVPFGSGHGVGRLLAQLLTTMGTENPGYPPLDAARLGTTAVDLITTLIGHHLDTECAAPAASRQRMLYLRARSFIDEHLASPDLAPAGVAAAHHVSLRYLQRVFQQHGDVVSEVIRRERLRRCRRDLADPALRHLAIHSIGARWGFPRPAEFSRAFRTATGNSPSQYRAQHLLPAGAALALGRLGTRSAAS